VDRLEQLLVEAVQRQLTRYALQDLRCVKCRRVSTMAMTDVCKCSGRLVGDELPKEFEDLLATLRRVAVHFNFAWLKETVDFALRIDAEDEQELNELQQQLLQQQPFLTESN
jgi:DNA polymerase epsilon subunit 1